MFLVFLGRGRGGGKGGGDRGLHPIISDGRSKSEMY